MALLEPQTFAVQCVEPPPLALHQPAPRDFPKAADGAPTAPTSTPPPPPPPPPPKVVAKDHARFIESYGTILKAHMDLKKKEKGKARAGGGGAAKAGGGGGGRKVAA